jgi:hypothetical protein
MDIGGRIRHRRKHSRAFAHLQMIGGLS